MIYYYCMMIILIIIFRLIMLCGLRYESFMLVHILWVTLHLCVSGYSCHNVVLLNAIFTLLPTVHSLFMLGMIPSPNMLAHTYSVPILAYLSHVFDAPLLPIPVMRFVYLKYTYVWTFVCSA